MTLYDLKKPKNLSVWFLGFLLILVPIEYWADPSFGQSALRISQAQIFQVVSIALFAIFILQNVWLSLFLLWSIFLYAFYGFPNPSGTILLSISGACMIYEAFYRAINRENFGLLVNFMIAFALLNMGYMIMQGFGWELMFVEFNRPKLGLQTQMLGFMGLKAIMGMAFAMCVPFFAYKYPKLALGLFVPLYYSESSSALVAGICAYLWQLWFLSRKWFFIALAALTIGGGFYVAHDTKAGMFEDRANVWKLTLQDAMRRPIFGWGMDSFRCVTNDKSFMYWKNVRTKDSLRIDLKDTIEYQHTGNYDLNKYKDLKAGDTLDPWDNPHNEYIMLYYEFGVVAVLLLGFLIWDIRRRFVETSNYAILLVGFLIATAIMSMGQFPFHLARVGFFIPIFLACYYKLTEPDKVSAWTY